MKLLFLAIIILFLSGCSFIVRDGENVKYYGMTENQARDLVEKISEKQAETSAASADANKREAAPSQQPLDFK